MNLKPQVILDENGFVKEQTTGGNIGGIEVTLPNDVDDFIANFRAYQLIDGVLVKNESQSKTIEQEKQLNILRRQRRAECFPVINRGALWYNMLTDDQKIELNDWYHKWLDVTETLVIPERPSWVIE